MRKTLLLLITALLMLPSIAQKKVDIDKEEAAIKAVINAESVAYRDGDLKKYKSCYLEENTTMIIVTENQYRMIKSWSEIEKGYKKPSEADNQVSNNFDSEHKDFKISIQGKSAHVSCIEFFKNNINGELLSYEQLKTMGLIKKGDQWKISMITIVQNPYKIEVPVMTDVQKHQRNKFMMSYMTLIGASYAKSMGKTIEEYGKYLGDQAKTTWDKNSGFEGYIRGMLYNFEAMRLSSADPIQIIKKTENFFQCKVPWDLKAFMGEKIHDITYEELMKLYGIAFNTIADYLDVKYEHKLLDNGNSLEITITK